MSIGIEGGIAPTPASFETETPSRAASPERPVASAPFEDFLRGLGSGVDQGEGMIGNVASGEWSSSDPGTLIALQAGIYRYTEAVDLAGKLVDRGGNAVRTVLHGGQ